MLSPAPTLTQETNSESRNQNLEPLVWNNKSIVQGHSLFQFLGDVLTQGLFVYLLHCGERECVHDFKTLGEE